MIRSILAGRLALFGATEPVMPLVNIELPAAASAPVGPKEGPTILVEYAQKNRAGLLVTEELNTAYERVREAVQDISRECRARNSKFRDIEWDLEEDRERCLHGLSTAPENRFLPSDVRRVTQAFSKPQFFVDGAAESDVTQGELGNCWFLSGIATVASMPQLVEKFCVERDEKVGVYGFIFQRDGIWTGVIIDDLLYTSIPKFEELTRKERKLYHSDKDRYNTAARKGGKTLMFAKSGTENETWVPLLEKAYAKLHGDYASLSGGNAGEAIEDLTGGVSTIIHVNDILDADVFWENELLHARDDRLFGCSIYNMQKTESASEDGTVNGLYTGHAYSILKAIEIRGKRFLRIRNPWGDSEWNGRWADGSKEWTSEWLDALDILGHTFGDDGAFIMEYEDFLDTWTLIHRTRLFDPSWAVSSLWINANLRGPATAWDFGDISFTFNMPTASPVIIVISQLDDRYYADLSGYLKFTLDFKLFRRGERRVLANSSHSIFFRRSVNAELDLEAGDYVVHVRADRQPWRPKDYITQSAPKWDSRKLTSVLTRGAQSTSIVSNFDSTKYQHLLPQPLEVFAGKDLHEVESEALERVVLKRQATAPRPKVSSKRSPAPTSRAGSNTASPAPTSHAPILSAPSAEDGQQDIPVDPDVNGFISPISATMPTFKHVEGVGIVPESPIVLVHVNGDHVNGAPKVDFQVEHEKDAESGSPVDFARPNLAANTSAPPSEVSGSAAFSGTMVRGPEGLPPPSDSPPARVSSFKTGLPNDPPSPPAIHEGILCDGCKKTLVGDRYKCLDCENYDLCSDCVGITEHFNAQHAFVRIDRPENAEERIAQARAVIAREREGSGPGDEPSGPIGSSSIPPLGVSTNGVYTHNAHCNGCGAEPLVGLRYKCMEITCPDYDLCGDCFDAQDRHDPGHRMMKITSPEDAQHIIEETEVDADNELAIGLRVFSKKECKTTIKGQLRHGKLSRVVAKN